MREARNLAHQKQPGSDAGHRPAQRSGQMHDQYANDETIRMQISMNVEPPEFRPVRLKPGRRP